MDAEIKFPIFNQLWGHIQIIAVSFQLHFCFVFFFETEPAQASIKLEILLPHSRVTGMHPYTWFHS
jgi:hypothetical protein